MLWFKFKSTSCEIAIMWMQHNTFDFDSVRIWFLQVMVWCRQTLMDNDFNCLRKNAYKLTGEYIAVHGGWIFCAWVIDLKFVKLTPFYIFCVILNAFLSMLITCFNSIIRTCHSKVKPGYKWVKSFSQRCVAPPQVGDEPTATFPNAC